MNQLDIFSEKIGRRHIGCKDPITAEQLMELKNACIAQNIPYNFSSQNNHLIYWVKNPITKYADDLCQVKTEYICPILHWSWFMYISWSDFLSLVQGTHIFKEQPYYDQLACDYDKPFKEIEYRNFEMNLDALFTAGHYAAIQ